MPSASIVDDHEIRELAIPPLGGDRQRSGPVVAIVIVVTGVATGVSGMLLGLLLHFVQHVAYGYSLDVVVSPESFLQGVTGAPPIRRVTALTICGAVAGIGCGSAPYFAFATGWKNCNSDPSKMIDDLEVHAAPP